MNKNKHFEFTATAVTLVVHFNLLTDLFTASPFMAWSFEEMNNFERALEHPLSLYRCVLTKDMLRTRWIFSKVIYRHDLFVLYLHFIKPFLSEVALNRPSYTAVSYHTSTWLSFSPDIWIRSNQYLASLHLLCCFYTHQRMYRCSSQPTSVFVVFRFSDLYVSYVHNISYEVCITLTSSFNKTLTSFPFFLNRLW